MTGGTLRLHDQLDDIPAQVIEDRPDIVFVTMGLNDNFSYHLAVASGQTPSTQPVSMPRQLGAWRLVMASPLSGIWPE